MATTQDEAKELDPSVRPRSDDVDVFGKERIFPACHDYVHFPDDVLLGFLYRMRPALNGRKAFTLGEVLNTPNMLKLNIAARYKSKDNNIFIS